MRKNGELAVAALLTSILLAAGCGGGHHASKPSPPEPRTVAAPADVANLPYYDPSWTFTDKSRTIEVQTNMYRDDEGKGFGMAVCNLTWSAHEDRDVMVLGSDGGPLAHRWTSLGEPCK